MSLTDANRTIISRARDLAALRGVDAIKAHAGETSTDMAYAVTLGEAQHLLNELAAIVAKLDGES